MSGSDTKLQHFPVKKSTDKEAIKEFLTPVCLSLFLLSYPTPPPKFFNSFSRIPWLIPSQPSLLPHGCTNVHNISLIVISLFLHFFYNFGIKNIHRKSPHWSIVQSNRCLWNSSCCQGLRHFGHQCHSSRCWCNRTTSWIYQWVKSLGCTTVFIYKFVTFFNLGIF